MTSRTRTAFCSVDQRLSVVFAADFDALDEVFDVTTFVAGFLLPAFVVARFAVTFFALSFGEAFLGIAALLEPTVDLVGLGFTSGSGLGAGIVSIMPGRFCHWIEELTIVQDYRSGTGNRDPIFFLGLSMRRTTSRTADAPDSLRIG